MEHCYIFDYTSSCIYHVKLPDEIEDVENYLCETYNFKSGSIYFMITNKKLTIEDL